VKRATPLDATIIAPTLMWLLFSEFSFDCSYGSTNRNAKELAVIRNAKLFEHCMNSSL